MRLRPVFLTAVTTILGLVPMATGVDFDFRSLSFITNSESSQWWKSMSIAVIFGLTVATVLTLVMVPTFYRAFFGLGDGAAEPAARGRAGAGLIVRDADAEAPRKGDQGGSAARWPRDGRSLSAPLLARPRRGPRRVAADRRRHRPPPRTLEEVVRRHARERGVAAHRRGEVRKAELRTKRYSALPHARRAAAGRVRAPGAEEHRRGRRAPQPARAGTPGGSSLTQPLYTGGRATAAYRGQKHLEASVRLQAELTRARAGARRGRAA